MKTKDIRLKIKESFCNQTPDNLNNIKARCQETTQLKKEVTTKSFNFKRAFIVTICFALILSIGFVVGHFGDDIVALSAQTSIYLDVNPSIEVKIDKHHRVFNCVANNEDGKKVLECIELKGVEVNTALYAIVGSMYTNGYLSEEANSILVSIQNIKGKEEILLDDITNQINNVFKENLDMECSIIAQKIEKNEHLKEEAAKYGISVGKLKLIKKIIELDEIYSDEDIETLAKMSIQELNLIYQTIFVPSDKIDKDEEIEDEEIITGKPCGFVDKEKALEIILKENDLTVKELRFCDIMVLYCENEKHQKQMVYLISIMTKTSNEIIDYVVDCQTGNILDNDILKQWEDKIYDNKHHGPMDDFYLDAPEHFGNY